MCVPTNPTEKHSSFALSPSSHTARHDFKGDAHDDDEDDDDDDDYDDEDGDGDDFDDDEVSVGLAAPPSDPLSSP